MAIIQYYISFVIFQEILCKSDFIINRSQQDIIEDVTHEECKKLNGVFHDNNFSCVCPKNKPNFIAKQHKSVLCRSATELECGNVLTVNFTEPCFVLNSYCKQIGNVYIWNITNGGIWYLEPQFNFIDFFHIVKKGTKMIIVSKQSLSKDFVGVVDVFSGHVFKISFVDCPSFTEECVLIKNVGRREYPIKRFEFNNTFKQFAATTMKIKPATDSCIPTEMKKSTVVPRRTIVITALFTALVLVILSVVLMTYHQRCPCIRRREPEKDLQNNVDKSLEEGPTYQHRDLIQEENNIDMRNINA